MGVHAIPSLNHVTAMEEPYSKAFQAPANKAPANMAPANKAPGEKEPLNPDAEVQQKTEDEQTAKNMPRSNISGKNTRFEYNKDIDRIVITISENGTDEVIKEIPPEEVQNMLKRIHTMTGMFMDEEA